MRQLSKNVRQRGQPPSAVLLNTKSVRHADRCAKNLTYDVSSRYVTDTYLDRIGGLIRDARKHRGLTQTQLADVLGTSQSAVHRIEAGNQNLSLEMVTRIAEALDSPLISVGGSGPQHLRVQGGAKLTGSIPVRSSNNSAVALLCASLLNRGRTVIRGIAKIEEVNRILEVLTSIGVRATWLNDGADLELIRPTELDLASMDLEAARRTRSVIMFLGPLLHSYSSFQLPYAGGCDLCARQRQPQLHGPGPLRLPQPPRSGDRRHRYDHIARPWRARHQRRRRVRAVRGPDRGNEPAHRGHRHPIRNDHRARTDRVSGDRARCAGGDGPRLHPRRRVRGCQRAHPVGGSDRTSVDAGIADRQDPSDAVPRAQHRQPAVLRGDRGDR